MIDYTSENFVDRKERYDIIFDAVGRRKSREAMLHSARALVLNGKRESVDGGTPDCGARPWWTCGNCPNPECSGQ